MTTRRRRGVDEHRWCFYCWQATYGRYENDHLAGESQLRLVDEEAA